MTIKAVNMLDWVCQNIQSCHWMTGPYSEKYIFRGFCWISNTKHTHKLQLQQHWTQTHGATTIYAVVTWNALVRGTHLDTCMKSWRHTWPTPKWKLSSPHLARSLSLAVPATDRHMHSWLPLLTLLVQSCLAPSEGWDLGHIAATALPGTIQVLRLWSPLLRRAFPSFPNQHSAVLTYFQQLCFTQKFQQLCFAVCCVVPPWRTRTTFEPLVLWPLPGAQLTFCRCRNTKGMAN